MKRKLKRQQRTIGSIVEIPLNNDYYTYARILDNFMAFYNIYTKEQPETNKIVSSDVLFFSAVYDSVITKGYWLKIGKKTPLEDKLYELPPFYTQDILNTDKYTIYDTNGKRPATKEECIGLEYYGVWEGQKMEERLNDYFTGKKTNWQKRLKMLKGIPT